MKIKISLFFVTITLLFSGVTYAEEASFETSGWIPYWKDVEGIESAIPMLDNLSEVNPFVYTVKRNGELFLNSDMESTEWRNFRTLAQAKQVRFIPTVMWANSDAIDNVLSDPHLRFKHVQDIAKEIYKHGYDGIDIDYEAKYARTREDFSFFLRQLSEAIGYDKWVMCTIESRTPLSSRYLDPADIPSDIEYSNDFKEINKYCDRVRLMAYDQGRFDRALNKAKDHPYIPVADIDWVRKVVELAKVDIDPEKIVVGVPTYGYEYDMFESLDGSGHIEYSRLWSFNPRYVDEVMERLGDKLQGQPFRNSAGEMFFTYKATDLPDEVVPLPFATRVMSWSDSESVRQKAELAKELGVRGLAVFKIDGGQDPGLFSILTAFKNGNELGKAPKLVVYDEPEVNVPGIDLEYGDRREEVISLQKILNENGFHVAQVGGGSPGQETKFFGPATRAALIKFQKAKSIYPAIGYYGPITRSVISKL